MGIRGLDKVIDHLLTPEKKLGWCFTLEHTVAHWAMVPCLDLRLFYCPGNARGVVGNSSGVDRTLVTGRVSTHMAERAGWVSIRTD